MNGPALRPNTIASGSRDPPYTTRPMNGGGYQGPRDGRRGQAHVQSNRGFIPRGRGSMRGCGGPAVGATHSEDLQPNESQASNRGPGLPPTLRLTAAPVPAAHDRRGMSARGGNQGNRGGFRYERRQSTSRHAPHDNRQRPGPGMSARSRPEPYAMFASSSVQANARIGVRPPSPPIQRPYALGALADLGPYTERRSSSSISISYTSSSSTSVHGAPNQIAGSSPGSRKRRKLSHSSSSHAGGSVGTSSTSDFPVMKSPSYTPPPPPPLSPPLRRDIPLELDAADPNPEREPSPTMNLAKIKQERSPTPPPLSRYLLTSGCKFCSPLPKSCMKPSANGPGDLNYLRNRKAWFQREIAALRKLGLQVNSQPVIRLDGMAIDWTSPTPVWSDTLLPEHPPELEIIDVDALPDHDPPPPSKLPPSTQTLRRVLPKSPPRKPKKQAKVVVPLTLPAKRRREVSSDIEIVESNPPLVLLQPLQAAPPPSPRRTASPSPQSNRERSVSIPHIATFSSHVGPASFYEARLSPEMDELDELEAVDEEPLILHNEESDAVLVDRVETVIPLEDFEDADEVEKEPPQILVSDALIFLERYITTFDMDRSDLTRAYSANAVFSYTLHRLAGDGKPRGKASTFAPREQARKIDSKHDSEQSVKRGLFDILATLLSFGPHSFCKPNSVESVDVQYDLANCAAGVLVCMYGEVSDYREDNESRVGLDQSFVLRHRDVEEEDRKWKLVAVNHQITIRELSS